jgi:class 3 adenylate cyclase/tetratricopeptide (TPR) repeat protein
MICPHCRAANGDGAQFCNQCGARLVADGAQGAAFHGERRQLTALFCDLVGSTELAKAHDPEEYHDIIRDFVRCCTAAVEPFGGHVAELRGDGALVYFGYPKSHGDEPERAVRAALGIVDAVSRTAASRGLPLRVRIGVATGLMAIDETILDKPAIVGEAVILAARLQEIAEPDTVVISALTHELAGGFFDVADLGGRELKGFHEPVPAWRVTGTKIIPSRFKAHHLSMLSPFVGRARERGIILDGWQRAKRGAGSVIAILGEPGIGKSRLIRSVRDELRLEARALEYFCSPYQMTTSLYPVTDRLARLAGFRADDTPERRVELLRAVLAAAGPGYAPHFPWFAAVMSVPVEGIAPTVTPEQRKQKMFDALLWWVTGHAARSPQLLILEDAHWCDPTSVEFLQAIADRVGTLALLVIVSVRAPYEAAWMKHPSVTQHTLDRLDDREASEIVAGISRDQALPPELVEQILKKTDGVPLFIEEFTKMVLGAGTGAQSVDLPATLQDSLAARLDQLAPDKQAAQCAAVIGREFSFDVLRAVAPLAPAVLEQSLARLVEAGFISAHGPPSERRFLFRHAMVRDAAYESLLKRDRRQIHGAVAAALERLAPRQTNQNAELLAHHYTEAGEIQQALKYWGIAALRAIQKSANLEAIQHTSRALDLIATLPDSRERRMQELGFRFLAGGAYWAVKGFSSTEVEQLFLRALELTEEVGNAEQSVIALRGLFGCYYARGELARAFAQGERIAALAERSGSQADRTIGHMQKGSILFWRGEHAAARRELESAIAAYNPAQHRARLLSTQIDPGANARYHLGWTLWVSGLPDQALTMAQRAIDQGRDIAQPLTLAMALFWGAAVKLSCGDIEGAAAATAELRDVTAEYHIRYLSAVTLVLEGGLLIERGETGAGIERLHLALAEFERQQAGLGRPWTMALIAEGCRRLGRVSEGLGMIEAAFAVARANDEMVWAPELHRLKGELMLTDSVAASAQAEDSLRTALRIAGRQGALSLQLRAALSLARMLAARHDPEAYEVLADVHSRFSEGFATRDLIEAARLLGGPRPIRAAGLAAISPN